MPNKRSSKPQKNANPAATAKASAQHCRRMERQRKIITVRSKQHRTENSTIVPRDLRADNIGRSYNENSNTYNTIVDPVFIDFARGITKRITDKKGYFFSLDADGNCGLYQGVNIQHCLGFDSTSAIYLINVMTNNPASIKFATANFAMHYLIGYHLQQMYNEFLSGAQYCTSAIPASISFIFNLWLNRRIVKIKTGCENVPFVPMVPITSDPRRDVVLAALKSFYSDNLTQLSRMFEIDIFDFRPTKALINESPVLIHYASNSDPVNTTFSANEIASVYQFFQDSVIYGDADKPDYNDVRLIDASGYSDDIPDHFRFLCSICAIDYHRDNEFPFTYFSDWLAGKRNAELWVKYKVPAPVLRAMYAYNYTVLSTDETVMTRVNPAVYTESSGILNDIYNSVQKVADKQGVSIIGPGSGNPFQSVIFLAVLKSLPSCGFYGESWLYNTCMCAVADNYIVNASAVLWRSLFQAEIWRHSFNYRSSYALPAIYHENIWNKADIAEFVTEGKKKFSIFTVLSLADYFAFGLPSDPTLDTYALIVGTPSAQAPAWDQAMDAFYTDVKVNTIVINSWRFVMPLAHGPEEHCNMKTSLPLFYTDYDYRRKRYLIKSILTSEELQDRNAHFWIGKLFFDKIQSISENSHMPTYNVQNIDTTFVSTNMSVNATQFQNSDIPTSEIDLHVKLLSMKREAFFGMLSRLVVKGLSFASGFIPVVGPLVAPLVDKVGTLVANQIDKKEQSDSSVSAARIISGAADIAQKFSKSVLN